MGSFRARLVTAAVTAVMVLPLVPTNAAAEDGVAFLETWKRTDQPVASSIVSRSWVWGPFETSYHANEPYDEAPNGRREVLYFDKSRMEINDPNGDPSSIWYITNGLLATEMISGRLQLGDTHFEQHAPADIPVAGDPDDTGGPTYATFSTVLDADPLPVGSGDDLVGYSWSIDRAGVVTHDKRWMDYGVTTAYHDTVTNHTIAYPFWTFMNSTGTVWENGQYVSAPLFVNPFYATGRPITEAYWSRVKVAGTVEDVLIQCFERRCLTYTPSNPTGWQIEMGNTGRHYYRWRYEQDFPSATSTAYLVSLNDGGPVGCGDTLVPIQLAVQPYETPGDQIAVTVQALLDLGGPYYGESGLFNTLWQASATVVFVSIDDGVATVNMSGSIPLAGECDDPRAAAQLHETVLEVPGITDAVFLLNGSPWPGPLMTGQ